MDRDKIKVSVTRVTSWQRVLNAARRTAGKPPLDQEPSKAFKGSMLRSQHSPLRLLEFDIVIENIPMWVTTHLVRHKIGVEHFVHSQREDRTDIGVSREELPQGALNDMQMSINAQALINISKERLCSAASPETRYVWNRVKAEIAKVEPELASYMQPKCVYTGYCTEACQCHFITSTPGQECRDRYVSCTFQV